MAPVCGIDPATIRTLADELATAPTAAVYGRIGTCTQEFGTLASWLVDVVNLLSGNLDRIGGAMFTTGAAGQPSEWEVMLRLAALVGGGGLEPDIAEIDDAIAGAVAGSAVSDERGAVHGRQPDELLELVGDRVGPERLLDIMLRTGPHGDGFGNDPDGLSLEQLEANPHGIDFGALEPDRVPDLLRTPSGKIEAFPDQMRVDIERLAESLGRDWAESIVLVGRRHVRSNNSWMHNVKVLAKGRNRCTMQIHPEDADRLGLSDGSPAKVQSRVGEVAIDVEITDGIRPGVVSIPHGFGQNMPGVQLRVAQEYRGVNTNVLTDEQFYDPVSGNIALNGVPVTIEPMT